MKQRAYNFLLLFVLNSILQVLDGVLTYIGVSLFGTSVEGNYLIRSAIEELGPEYGLALPKLLAIFLLFCLYRHSKNSANVEKVLYIILGFYSAVVLTWIISLASLDLPNIF